MSIPSIERPEWASLVKGEYPHKFQNFVLQMKINESSKGIANGSLKVDDAIKDIYALCSKYAVAVQSDFKVIFKTW